jgi:hypothetical protein
MSVHALHQGIRYELSEARPGEWRWSFVPPKGPPQSGRVRGKFQFAVSVVRRAIEVWYLMNPDERSRAA